MIKKHWVACVMIALALALVSCSSTSGPDGGDGDGGETSLPTVTVSGTVVLPAGGSTVDESDLRVVSPVAQADVAADGSFTVDVVDSDTYQWLLVVTQSGGDMVLIGLYEPGARSAVASTATTARALAAGVPHLIYTTHSMRSAFHTAAQSASSYTDLVANLDAAHLSDARDALDPDENPTVYQLAIETAEEAMTSLGSAARPALSPPHVEDATGDDVLFVSEREIWYVAGVYNTGGTLLDAVTVDGDDDPTYAWGWPPVTTAAEHQTSYDLGDGTFAVTFHKGDDFTKTDDWDDPIGRATALNTARGALYLTELVVGYDADVDATALSAGLSIPSLYASELLLAMRQGRTERFISHFCGMLGNEAGDVADWIHDGTAPGPGETYIEGAAFVLEHIAYYLEVLGATTATGPFFWDWLGADADLGYDLVQASGVLTSIDGLLAPVCEFTIAPPAGIVGTDFALDASVTTDDNDVIGDIEFRWDWTSDGTWDTSWSTTATATHAYSSGGAHTITLQARDTDGLISAVTHSVNVGGGAGTANHIKLFRDYYPWGLDTTVEVIEQLGFTEGSGANQYEILASTAMATVDLIPGQDLVILCNDQDQTFYNNYAASQSRFTNFVYTGGSLLWEACDLGWNYGSMSTAGIVLPGNVGYVYEYCYYNYIPTPELPLVEGLPTTMDHNYASHESFYNLPDGATVYCTDEYGDPTLIEYSLGGGWVIMSGQPLEHQVVYPYGTDEMSALLPRIVSYFTGVALPGPARFETAVSPRATSGR